MCAHFLQMSNKNNAIIDLTCDEPPRKILRTDLPGIRYVDTPEARGCSSAGVPPPPPEPARTPTPTPTIRSDSPIRTPTPLREGRELRTPTPLRQPFPSTEESARIRSRIVNALMGSDSDSEDEVEVIGVRPSAPLQTPARTHSPIHPNLRIPPPVLSLDDLRNLREIFGERYSPAYITDNLYRFQAFLHHMSQAYSNFCLMSPRRNRENNHPFQLMEIEQKMFKHFVGYVMEYMQNK